MKYLSIIFMLGWMALFKTSAQTLEKLEGYPFIMADEEPVPLNIEEIQKKIGYPIQALNRGIEGGVVARILVGKTGEYVKHELLGVYKPFLSEQVSHYVQELKFTPAIKDGDSIEFWVNVPFYFKPPNNFEYIPFPIYPNHVMEDFDRAQTLFEHEYYSVARQMYIRKLKGYSTCVPALLMKGICEYYIGSRRSKSSFKMAYKYLTQYDLNDDYLISYLKPLVSFSKAEMSQILQSKGKLKLKRKNRELIGEILKKLP